ncbi:unnamed protein product [Nyctereutes procyonoides]|uniref:(raccoon dog) hypothetical protein n=1 Tax=Nyctereutes procyonoides TaxID=34880 RepID=A0A811Y974_NYCPR|nr:unnamed protein product [Nyctereutes procyonoides]
MSRLNLCPPRRKKTRKTNLPSWGQIKKLTSQATSLIRRLISTQSYSWEKQAPCPRSPTVGLDPRALGNCLKKKKKKAESVHVQWSLL